MTETAPTPADPAQDAIARALAAAALATDAAHEAEAAIAARSDAAQSMARVARRATWAAGLAGGASVLVLALGTLVWMRSAADLRQAAEIQSAAAAAFVERLAEMNGALDRMDLSIVAQEAGIARMETGISTMLTDMQAEVLTIAREQLVAQPSANEPLTPQIERLRADILAAVAASEMALADRIGRQPAPAPAPTPVAAPAARTEAKASPRPAARPKAAAAPNPFRYP